MHKIKGYRKINAWENFFLDSAIYSIAQSVGINYDSGFHFISAITGDMFAYLYNKNKPCDSGITNYFYMPDVVKKVYSVFGYDCIYFSNEQIKKYFKQVINSIKKSIDLNIPVLGWGFGNVPTRRGSYTDSLPEGCLIGGYDDNDNLFVNLYLGSDRLPEGAVDEDGYTLISNGLEATFGVFIVGEKKERPELIDIYTEAINSIPSFLAHGEANGYTFGERSFEKWSETLLDDSNFLGKTDDELGDLCWNLHCSPYCCVCTMDSRNYIKNAVELFPDMEIAPINYYHYMKN